MYKSCYLISLVGLVLFCTACQPAPAAPLGTIPPLTLSPIFTHTPSPTDHPTPTTAPTETPAPTLPRFEAEECRFYPARILNVECGYLYVPENRDQEDGRSIRLHVAIARSYSEDPEPDPLIYLSGGPGSYALEWLDSSMRNFSNILKKRTVIFFDPRGVGYSEPSLDCPEVMEAFHELLGQAYSEEELVKLVVEANLACQDRLVNAGVDLTAYNSAEIAADVNDLRVALGYDQVNLFGVSYGTRSALTVMRDYPDILRGVVLDSIVPLEVDLFGADAINAERSLNLLFERCAADEACNAAYPDLGTAFDELADKLKMNPITIQVRHLVTNETYDVWVDEGVLGASVVEALYNHETAVYLPKMIYETLEGEDERYQTLATSLEIYLLYGDYSSEAMRHSVLCSDEGTFSDHDLAREKTANVHPPIAEYFIKDLEITLRTCDAWNTKAGGAIENQPVVSDIPTLLLSGELDPVTPPEWGRQVAEMLDNAHFVEFPGLGHFVYSERGCARDIVADFLAEPNTAPDSNCINFIRFNFITH